MKKIIAFSLFVSFCYIIFTACNTATPEKYFDLAVLNSNMLIGFANEGLLRELESPSVKLGANNEAVPMQRSEVINAKIKFAEENLKKLKRLKETAETKDMLQTSVALYEHVLSAYKNEYYKLAELYDGGAAKPKLQSLAQSINSKYFPRFEELYNKLISIGKVYAKNHNIEVRWAM